MDSHLPEPRVLLEDRGYDADRIRKTMKERDILTQSPMRKTRKMRVARRSRALPTAQHGRALLQQS